MFKLKLKSLRDDLSQVSSWMEIKRSNLNSRKPDGIDKGDIIMLEDNKLYYVNGSNLSGSAIQVTEVNSHLVMNLPDGIRFVKLQPSAIDPF